MRVSKICVNSDLSKTSLEEAFNQLPAAKIYRLQIPYKELVYAQNLLREIGNEADSRFAPIFSLEPTPLGKSNSWALWSGEDCVWSEGV